MPMGKTSETKQQYVNTPQDNAQPAVQRHLHVAAERHDDRVKIKRCNLTYKWDSLR